MITTDPELDDLHYPTITVKSAALSGKPGDIVTLSATTDDPDHDEVSVPWWRFEDNGTYAGAVTLDTTEGLTTSFRIPADAKSGDTVHIIARATDDGTLPLTRYAHGRRREVERREAARTSPLSCYRGRALRAAEVCAGDSTVA